MDDTSTIGRAKTMRRPMTPPEARLWTRLRGHRLDGHKFRRQHPIGPFILDFYCVAARLAVEVDGRVHDSGQQMDHDLRRTRWLMSQGIRVIRVAAIDVRDELEGVLGFIARVTAERLAEVCPRSPLRSEASGEVARRGYAP